MLRARAGASSTKRSPESSTARCAAHQAAMEAALACFFSASWGCRRVFARLSGAARASQGRFVLVAWRGAVLQADSTVNHGVQAPHELERAVRVRAWGEVAHVGVELVKDVIEGGKDGGRHSTVSFFRELLDVIPKQGLCEEANMSTIASRSIASID